MLRLIGRITNTHLVPSSYKSTNHEANPSQISSNDSSANQVKSAFSALSSFSVHSEYESKLNQLGIDKETIALLNSNLDDNAIKELSEKFIFDQTIEGMLNISLPANIRRNISLIIDEHAKNNSLQTKTSNKISNELKNSLIEYVEERNIKMYSADVIFLLKNMEQRIWIQSV